MDDYTPNTDQIKYRYQLDVGNSPIAGRTFEEAGGEFDRWLAAHDLEVRMNEANLIAGLIAKEFPVGIELNLDGTEKPSEAAWVAGGGTAHAAVMHRYFSLYTEQDEMPGKGEPE